MKFFDIIEFVKRILGCRCSEKDIEIIAKDKIIGDIKKEIEELKKGKKIAEPKSYGIMGYNETNSILRPITENLFISDTYLNLTTVGEASKYSNETKLQYKKWVAEDFDCDNFSFALMGYWSEGLKSFAFGIAWSATHAFNIMVDKDKKVWIVEPQSNTYFELEKIKQNQSYWPLKLVLI